VGGGGLAPGRRRSCAESKLQERRQRRLDLLLTLRKAREELGRWPTGGEWEASTSEHVSRRSHVRQFGSWRPRLSDSRSAEAVSFTVLVPADDSLWDVCGLRRPVRAG
jgi:hypothetical protein